MDSSVSSIKTIDLHYLGIPQAIAAFVVMAPDGPVLIETGPASTLPALERRLNELGLKLNDIRHALVTHIHLDHAGAAGQLARNGTRIHVHEFGARHLADPTKLIDSATRIYGAQMDRLWGSILPVPQQLITPVRDGEVINAGGLHVRAIETPGHARHHHAYSMTIDGKKIGIVGDVAGFNAPAVSDSYHSVPTPPPEFDLEAWLRSIERLQRERFDAIHLTHFGRVDNPAQHLTMLTNVLQQHSEFIRTRLVSGGNRDEILAHYIEWNRAEAAAAGIVGDDFARYVSRNLLIMNVDGMIRYWTARGPATNSLVNP